MASFLDAFLQINGPKVEGECTDVTFAGAIQLLSFKFGFSGDIFEEEQETKKQVTEAHQEYQKDQDDKVKALNKARGQAASKGKPVRGSARTQIRSDKSQMELKKKTGNIMQEKKWKDQELYQFTIDKYTDKASPALMAAYFSTSKPTKTIVYRDATVSLRKSGISGSRYMIYMQFKFTGVQLMGYSMKADVGGPPKETIAFCFQTCSMYYFPQAADGSRGATNIKGWSFKEHKAM